MHFLPFLSTLSAVLSLPLSTIAAPDLSGSWGYEVSDCDKTHAAKYYATSDNIDNPVCVPWPDGNIVNDYRDSDTTGFDCARQSLSASSSIQ